MKFLYVIFLVGLSWMQQIKGRNIYPPNSSKNYRSDWRQDLTTSDSTLSCPDRSGNLCYYQTFRFTPSITGYYDFVVESDIDTDANLYYAPFNRNQPNMNLPVQGHHNYRQRGVQLGATLTANHDIVLVFTTHQPASNVPLKVTVTGPSVLNIEADNILDQSRFPVTTAGPDPVHKNEFSPLIKNFSWGRVTVEGEKQEFKDLKLFPGGAVPWDWRKTGTRHEPGIQPTDIEELVLDHNCDVIILSRGVDRRLKTMGKTQQYLKSYGMDIGKDFFILQSELAVKKYNELAKKKSRVCAVIHSTC